MGAKNLLHFGWIDVLSAADDHIAFAVGEIIVAVLVATGHVADSTISAAKRLSCLFWQLPIALKRIWRVRIKFADFAIADLITFWIKELDLPGTEAFPAYRTELGQLLFGTQQSHPSRFSGTVGLIELRFPEVFQEHQLGVLAGWTGRVERKR